MVEAGLPCLTPTPHSHAGDSFRERCVVFVAEGFPVSFNKASDGLPTDVSEQVVFWVGFIVGGRRQMIKHHSTPSSIWGRSLGPEFSIPGGVSCLQVMLEVLTHPQLVVQTEEQVRPDS